MVARGLPFRRLSVSGLRRGDGRAVRGGLVVEYAVAVVAGDDLFAAADLGHHLRPQRDEAGRTRTVARLGLPHAVAYARGDAVILALDSGRQGREQALALASTRLDLFGARARLLLE